MQTFFTAMLGMALLLLTSCRSVERGRVGVDYEAATPVGTVKGAATLRWDLRAPDDTWNGEVTWIGEDGKPMADTPPGKITNGQGSGVVPAGAAGWQITMSQSAPQNLTALHQFLLIGHHQGLDYSDTPILGDGRVYDYTLLLDAATFRDARDQAELVLNRRTQQIPAGVEIVHMIDLQLSNGAFIGEFVQDDAVQTLTTYANGTQVGIHAVPATSNNGYHTYPITVPKREVNILSAHLPSHNVVRNIWSEATSVVDYKVDFTWTPQ